MYVPSLEMIEQASSDLDASDPTAHPEVCAIRTFTARHGRSALPHATLYTNVEPCPMCAGAVYYAAIRRLVYGVSRERFDALVADIRGRPRRAYQGCRAIVGDLGQTQVSGPILEMEGLARLSIEALAPRMARRVPA